MEKTNHNEKILMRCLYCYKPIAAVARLGGVVFCQNNHGECEAKYAVEAEERSRK